MKLLIIFLVGLPMLSAQTFQVIHKKRLWPDGKGEVRITEEAIEFQAEKEGHSRRWGYADIQYFDRLSRKEFIILSYEDQRWRLGRDRQFHFVITDGKLDDRLFETVSRRLGKPVTNRSIHEIEGPEYELPVKHQHSFGGCEGRLVFTSGEIYYLTDHAPDAREWRMARDVRSVSSAHPYHLELRVYDNNRREFSRTRVFKFDLKQPLDGAFYRGLKLKLYELEANHQVLP